MARLIEMTQAKSSALRVRVEIAVKLFIESFGDGIRIRAEAGAWDLVEDGMGRGRIDQQKIIESTEEAMHELDESAAKRTSGAASCTLEEMQKVLEMREERDTLDSGDAVSPGPDDDDADTDSSCDMVSPESTKPGTSSPQDVSPGDLPAAGDLPGLHRSRSRQSTASSASGSKSPHRQLHARSCLTLATRVGQVEPVS